MATDGTVAFVGTERFWRYYSSSTPSNKIREVADWCKNTWDDHVKDGNQYELGTMVVNEEDKIPEDTLPDCGASPQDCPSLSNRLSSADSWMYNQNNIAYNVTDTLLVLDYYGLDENTYGWGYVGTAGQNRYNTGLVDMWWGDNDELPGLLSGVQSSGVAYHEMCHVFGSEHPADVANRNSGMYH